MVGAGIFVFPGLAAGPSMSATRPVSTKMPGNPKADPAFMHLLSREGPRGHRHYAPSSCGPASMISGAAISSYCWKCSLNRPTRWVAFSS